MKRRDAIKTILGTSLLTVTGAVTLLLNGCVKAGHKARKKFRFAFFTDVHLLCNNDRNSHIGFQRVLDDVLPKGVDFILFGGDNIDAYHLEEAEADALYKWFKEEVEKRGIKAYYTIGNHDAFYTPVNRETDPFSFELHRKYFGVPTYSFEHKGIHFIVLNSVIQDSNGYNVGDEQRRWMEEDLKKTGTQTPIVVSMHVPIQSLYYPAVEGKIVSTDMITDFKQVWDILEQYNVKMILQGHQHLHEELFVKEMRFVTGGAVCGNWWGIGDFYKTDKGYLLVDVNENNDFTWEYIAFVKEKEAKERWEYTQGSSQYNND